MKNRGALDHSTMKAGLGKPAAWAEEAPVGELPSHETLEDYK
jgi:hypothetical protein